MPDNPTTDTVLAKAKAARVAQDKLRAAMAAVSAEVKAAPAAPPAPAGKP